MPAGRSRYIALPDLAVAFSRHVELSGWSLPRGRPKYMGKRKWFHSRDDVVAIVCEVVLLVKFEA